MEIGHMSMKDPRLENGGNAKGKEPKTVRNAGSGKRPAANSAYKYRIYPYEDQAILIAKTFGCCRLFWNLRLEDVTWAWHEYEINIWPEPRDYTKDERYSFMAEVDQQALQNVKLDQKQAFKNFFEKPDQYGFPKRKKRVGLVGSYTTDAHYYKKGDTDDYCNINIDYEANMINLPKLGQVPICVHRKLPDGAIVKKATVSRDSAGRFFVSVGFFDPELARILSESGLERAQDRQEILCTGLDYSSANLFIDEMGLSPGAVKHYAKHERMLARRQRQLSRKVKGSRNYYKKLRQVNKLHRKIANCRSDFLHKLALAYARTFDVVCVETLNMRAMANKGFHMGKSTYDNGWGFFLRVLAYKMARHGGVLVKVDKWLPSSKMCGKCGYKYDALELSERAWTCPACGAHRHRDRNAAWNILVEGVRMLVDGEVEWPGMADVGDVSSYAKATRENAKREKKNKKRAEQGKPLLELVEVPARTSACLPASASCFTSAGGTPVTGGRSPGMPVGRAGLGQ